MTEMSEIISKINNNFVSYLILVFIIIILIIMIWYMTSVNTSQQRQCDNMNTIYSTINGNIRSINEKDPNCQKNLYDYYIKTAYNACSGGTYKNDFVNICNLKSILKEGVRGLDFEIYSIDNEPVVSTSTKENFYIKETYNYVPFSDVMSCIKNYAFSSSTAPNNTDPILIHLRIRSNNQEMYKNLANIFKSYNGFMLGKEYSFENHGNNIGEKPLLNFKNKIILMVDKSNNAFLENKEFLEFVNITSNSIFMRLLNYYDVKNTPDITELQNFDKRGMSIVVPEKTSNPSNSSGILCRDAGCQMVAFRYQYQDNFLHENINFFNNAGYAFVLKPPELRYQPVTIPPPQQQDPELSYETRNVSTDYYSFNF